MAKSWSKGWTYQPCYDMVGLDKVPKRIGFKVSTEIATFDNYGKWVGLIRDADYVAIDTETMDPETGKPSLKFNDVSLVMVIISVPDNHNLVIMWDVSLVKEGTRALLTGLEQNRALVKQVLAKPVIFMWNRMFDQRVLLNPVNNADNWLAPEDFFRCVDAMNLLFFADTNVKGGLGLKKAAVDFLGLDMPTFEESVTDNWRATDMKVAAAYAARDGYATVTLGVMLYRIFTEHSPFIVKLDLSLSNALYYLCSQELPTALEPIKELERLISAKVTEITDGFYAKYGKVSLGSTQQKAALLQSLGYSTNTYTDTGNMSTAKAALEPLAASGCEPARYMLDYSKYQTLLSNFVSKIVTHLEAGYPARFQLLASRVPTLRLASGAYRLGRKKEDVYHYYVPINSQAIAKPKHIFRELDFDLVSKEINFLSGDRTGQYYVEAGARELNTRCWIGDKPGHVLVETDFHALELCLDPRTCYVISQAPGKEPELVKLIHLKEHLDHIWTEAGFAKVDRYYETGAFKKCELQLKSGRKVTCSSKHKFMVKRDNGLVPVEFSRLTPLDVVPEDKTYSEQWDLVDKGAFNGTPDGLSFFGKSRPPDGGFKLRAGDTCNDMVSYISGFSAAVKPGKGYGYIAVSSKVIASELYELYGDQLSEPVFRRVLFRRPVRFNVWVLEINSLILADAVKNLKFDDKLFNSQTQIGYVRGLWDSSGSFTDGVWSLTVTSGVKDRILPWFPDPPVVTKRRFNRYTLSVSDPGNLWRLFVWLYPTMGVPFCEAAKKPFEKYIKDGMFKSNIGYLNYFEEMVDMIDIYVPPNHTFYVNGVLSHNCIPTNLSREPVWLEAYKNKVDLHKQTASIVFNEPIESVTYEHRQLAKRGNFSLLYLWWEPGAGYDGMAYVLNTRCGIPLDIASDMAPKYVAALPVLYQWKLGLYDEVMRTGKVTNIYGFDYRLRGYAQSGVSKIVKYAKKLAISDIVQGLGGFFGRMALVKLAKTLYYPGAPWKGSGVTFVDMIHDSITCCVPVELLDKWIPVQVDVMESLSPSNWEVPLDVSVSIGRNRGELFEVKRNADGVYVPVSDPDKRKSVQVADEAPELMFEEEDDSDSFDFL